MADYTALKSAIKTGTKRVKYADKEVEYHSLDDMMRLLKCMEADLGLNSSAGSRRYAQFTKDL